MTAASVARCQAERAAEMLLPEL
ncbi:MAG: hypothetical protein QOE43_2242, partial [Gaiellaceae bacterium]|nr:hypothetical protein [Gaiellaceae bacterium]